jgi:protein gp37
MIFVASMSDLFHEGIPFDFIQSAFRTMVTASQHVFQILTKRSRRLASLAEDLPWPENIWAGVTVEDRHNSHRIEDLIRVPARLRFVSCEPLIGPLPELPLESIDWLIVGGESGPGARPMEEEWVDGIHRQCNQHGVPFFFKQWGGIRKQASGRLLHGRVHDDLPPAVPDVLSSTRVASD